jgi:hypothetical protein
MSGFAPGFGGVDIRSLGQGRVHGCGDDLYVLFPSVRDRRFEDSRCVEPERLGIDRHQPGERIGEMTSRQ